MAHVTEQKAMDPGDIRRVLAAARSNSKMTPRQMIKPKPKPDAKCSILTIDGKQYMQINVACYTISRLNTTIATSLVDRGANGGLAGSDVRVLHKTMRKVDITGVDNHKVEGLDVVTAAGGQDSTWTLCRNTAPVRVPW